MLRLLCCWLLLVVTSERFGCLLYLARPRRTTGGPSSSRLLNVQSGALTLADAFEASYLKRSLPRTPRAWHRHANTEVPTFCENASQIERPQLFPTDTNTRRLSSHALGVRPDDQRLTASMLGHMFGLMLHSPAESCSAIVISTGPPITMQQGFASVEVSQTDGRLLPCRRSTPQFR